MLEETKVLVVMVLFLVFLLLVVAISRAPPPAALGDREAACLACDRACEPDRIARCVPCACEEPAGRSAGARDIERARP